MYWDSISVNESHGDLSQTMEIEYVRIQLRGITVKYLRRELVLDYLGFTSTKPPVIKRIAQQLFGRSNIVSFQDVEDVAES